MEYILRYQQQGAYNAGCVLHVAHTHSQHISQHTKSNKYIKVYQ